MQLWNVTRTAVNNVPKLWIFIGICHQIQCLSSEFRFVARNVFNNIAFIVFNEFPILSPEYGVGGQYFMARRHLNQINHSFDL